MKTHQQQKTCLFISEACLLDHKSGAARSMRATLRALADSGWCCHAVTMTLFDGDAEYPIAQSYPQLGPQKGSNELVTFDDDGVEQRIMVTGSTRHKALRPRELREFIALAQEELARLKPDIVLTYSTEALRPLLAAAQQRGARTLFYVANPFYAQRQGAEFHFIDAFLMPSQALVEFYRERMGIDAQVLRDPVEILFDGRGNLCAERIASRRQRYVTMINPEPAKGGLFFLNIVAQAKALAPRIRFRAVESRWGRADWLDKGVDPELLDSVDWHPLTDDMASIYADAALLLVPSLCVEASARVVAEALLAGVPVLAMNRGGIAEQLNEGGILFEPPEAMTRNYYAPPDKTDLHRWLKFVKVLMEDDVLYTRAVKLALKGSQLHDPAVNRNALVEIFERLSAKPTLRSKK